MKLNLWRLCIAMSISVIGMPMMRIAPANAQNQLTQSEEQCIPPIFEATENSMDFTSVGQEGVLNQSSRTLEGGQYYGIHTIYGHKDEPIAITILSEEFDSYVQLSYVQLIDDEQNVIAVDDNIGDGVNAPLQLTLPYTGTYIVTVGAAKAGEVGRYTLFLQGERYARIREGIDLYQASLRLASRDNLSDAIAATQRAIGIYVDVLGNCHTQTAEMIEHLESLQQRQIMSEPTAEERARLIARLKDLLLTEESTKNISEKIKLLKEIIEIYRQIPPEYPLELAGKLVVLAQFIYIAQPIEVDGEKRFNYVDAVPLHQEAIDIILSRDWSISDKAKLVPITEMIGRFFKEGLANFQGAEIWFLKGIEYQIEAGIPFEDSFFSESISALGFLTEIYLRQNRYNDLIELHKKVIEYNREVEVEPLEFAETLSDIARFYRAIGRPDQAENFYREALAVYRESLSLEDSDRAQYRVANALHSLALTIQDQGRYDEARHKLEEAALLARNLSDDFEDNLPNFLNSLAEIYRIQALEEPIEDLYLEALDILRDNKNDDGQYQDEELAPVVLYNLGGFYFQQKRYEDAKPFLEEAIMLFERDLHNANRNILTAILPERFYISALNSLALLSEIEGDDQKAISLYSKTVSIFENRELDVHPLLGKILYNMAWLYLNMGNTHQAILNANRSADIFEENLNAILSSGSEAERQEYMRTLKDNTNFNVRLHLQMLPDNIQAAELAITTILRRKGRILDAGVEAFQGLRRQQNNNPQVLELLDQLTDVRRNLSSLLFGNPESLPPESRQVSINDLLQQEQLLESQLNDLSTQFRLQNESITLANVQAQVPQNSALVEFFRYRSQGTDFYVAYILHHQGNPKWVSLGKADTIDQAIRDFLIALQSPRNSGFAEKGKALDRLIMQPVRELLRNTQHLLISADSQLNLIPFAALVDEQDQYLIESYQLTYLTSGRDLLNPHQDSLNQQQPVILADPNFEHAEDVRSVEIARIISPSSDGARAVNRRSDDITHLTFGSLPGTADEAEAISKLLPDAIPPFMGSLATENVLKQLRSPSILHIATHGFFLENNALTVLESLSNDEQRASLEFIGRPSNLPDSSDSLENALLRSGLALAGFNARKSGDEDGVLTALEAAGLNLSGTELVVLSACETGVGDVSNGEGVYGLRRAFNIAGAESLLMSLWQVSDYGTSALMQVYYENLIKNGQGRSEALRNAQLELIDTDTYRHPYFWASFILSGEWSPLDNR